VGEWCGALTFPAPGVDHASLWSLSVGRRAWAASVGAGEKRGARHTFVPHADGGFRPGCASSDAV